MQSTRLAASVAVLLGAAVMAASAAPARESAWAAAAAMGRPSPAHPAVVRGAQRYVLTPQGNSARYFVREQLAGINFPSDAVGVTDRLTGGITLDDNGRIVSADSKIVADITTLKSDRDRRDGFIQRRTLETDKYPTVMLVPTELTGLTMPLPDSGRASFTLVGDLTVHGVTRPTTWNIPAFFRGGQIRGTASTGFTFDDFRLEKPKVGSVLSVADSIHLAYDFDLVPATGAAASTGS